MIDCKGQSSALLFANGILRPGEAVRRVLATQSSSTIVCADGGALHARALGLQPQFIIGDMDSLSAADARAFEAAGAQIIQHPPEKDETDLELALRFCQEMGAKAVTILGGLGGRFDQTLANILLLTLPALASMRIELVDGAQTIRLLSAGVHKIAGAAGDTVSLVPLRGAATGITTRGLQYALRSETLLLGPARGISNVMLAAEAEVELGGGLLLLTHTTGRA
ncbi:MAG: thiamine diphosphokinase [Chloroflexi bacterium]|nr:thiamine diphosphokinase [Chloroflexota bacterium]MCY4247315.1 thiamine diphosphokinase [Chloroflexota bacterium]